MEQSLKGKAVVVTGAGRKTGIGFGIAETIAACGADVILTDIPDAASTMAECVEILQKKHGSRVLDVELDVTSPESIAAAAAKIRLFSPQLHGLVNNAGANMGASLVGDYDPALWAKVLDINLVGPFRVIQALLPLMDRGSSIVNMASRAGKRPLPTCSAYSTSKAGLIMLTKCLAVEYGPRGIRANAVCPGQILTEMNLARYAREAAAQKTTAEAVMARAVETVPLGRIGMPDDVGKLTAFLLSDASSYMTGQAVNITGGQLTEL